MFDIDKKIKDSPGEKRVLLILRIRIKRVTIVFVELNNIKSYYMNTYAVILRNGYYSLRYSDSEKQRSEMEKYIRRYCYYSKLN
jgi:hypothetical protein